MAPSPRRNPFAPLEKEDAATFVLRMQSTTLKNWPAEVLVEWLHRHANYPGGDVYRFLDYRSFRFDRETWPLDRVPGGEAFDNPSRATFSSNLRERAKTSYDWLARYMWEHGTWNTPIILLRNEPAGLTFPRGPALRAPLHLLEGHKRLSYLINLRAEGLARSDHDVWLVSLPSGARELESGTYFDAK